MNAKTAKRLRREARYHPAMKREYVTITGDAKRVLLPEEIKLVKGIPTKMPARSLMCATSWIELKESDPRVLYKELKKEYYGK